MFRPEQNYASIILRLLLEGELDPAQQRQIIWGDVLQIAAENSVLIRVVDELETLGLEPRHFFCAAVKEMRARNQRKLALINQISQRCIEAGVEFIFAKALQNYPDMTGDIDLYLASQSPNFDAVILAGLQARPVKRTLRNRIDGTANYIVPGCESFLEIHHGRIGMLGEHKFYAAQVIDNARFVMAEKEGLLVPSPEDQIILQALQRLVQRSYLRLSDIVVTISILRRHTLNWNYILKTVKELNIFYGLSCYLSFIETIYLDTFGRTLLPNGLRRRLLLEKPASIEFKRGFYRFQRFRVGGKGYADKFCSAVLAENWTVASRLSLLPVLALNTVFRKLKVS